MAKRDKEGYYIILKMSVHQEGTTVININGSKKSLKGKYKKYSYKKMETTYQKL